MTPLEGHIAISPRSTAEIDAQISEVKRTKAMLKRRGSVDAMGPGGMGKLMLANVLEDTGKDLRHKGKDGLNFIKNQVVRGGDNKVVPLDGEGGEGARGRGGGGGGDAL